MKSYQEQVLGALEAEAVERDVPIAQEELYDNVGTLIVGSPDAVIFTMYYNFQSGSKNMFLFNGAEHGPSSPDRYYFAPSESDEYVRLRARFIELLEGKGL